PPRPSHRQTHAFKVRLDTARQRKSHAVAATREVAYARYANIYKDHAAETYACNIEATRQGKGAREAYQRRVVSASTDTGRYRGYVEMSTPRGGRGGGDGGFGPPLLGTGGGSVSTGFGSSSGLGDGSSDSGAGFSLGDSSTTSSRFGSSVSGGLDGGSSLAPVVAVERGPEGVLHDRRGEERLGDGAASECSAITAGGSEICSTSGAGGVAEHGNAAATGREEISGGGGRGGGGGSDIEAFEDVVQFNNIRAKYMRPWDDTKLSGMYQVKPSPNWRANRAAGSRGIGGPPTATSSDAIAASTGSGRTIEAYRRLRQNGATARRRSRTLNWKEIKAWGAQ
ncbi:unnamed protein product, partial [Hapterophycus canaliculatus]